MEIFDDNGFEMILSKMILDLGTSSQRKKDYLDFN